MNSVGTYKCCPSSTTGLHKVLSSRCTSLLADTLYIDPGPQVLLNAVSLIDRIRILSIANDISSELREAAKKATTELLDTVLKLRTRLASGGHEEPKSPTVLPYPLASELVAGIEKTKSTDSLPTTAAPKGE